jgi:arylsulfatase A-like enzyme/uncharacterized membrane protein YbhN (UPF0104 family)
MPGPFTQMLILAIAAVFTAVAIKQQPLRGRIFRVFKLYLTVLTVWALLFSMITKADGTEVQAWLLIYEQLQSIDATLFWTFAAIAAAIRFLGVLASMIRWQLILRGQEIELPFWHILGAFLIGRAIGFFLPSTAGLDGYKLYDAARFSGRTVEVTAGTALEKVLGVTGIFLTFLVALPFGISIFGENALTVGAITIPLALGVITGLLTILWFPGLVQWAIENLPLPAKARLQGIVIRLSEAAAAYRDKKGLVLAMLAMSFLVHFCTAVMYYFMAVAVTAGTGQEVPFWPLIFGSSIQIFATVLGPTIGGIGIREAAQVLTVGSIIGLGAAAVSAHLGFWISEVPTLFGFLFWIARGENYRPAYCRVAGEQVDYEEAARAATDIQAGAADPDTPSPTDTLPPVGERVLRNAGLGFGGGSIAGLIIGVIETLVIAQGGFGEEAQVLWYGPMIYASLCGALGAIGGAVLGVLPMDHEEAQGWTPALAMLATLVPLGLAITVFRLRRDVFLEQMPPLPVLLGVLAGFAVIALGLFFGGRRLFRGPLGRVVQPIPATALVIGVTLAGFIAQGALGLGLAGSAGPGTIPPALERSPNIILVMVDTLRADHLDCYGASDVATPNLCAVATDGGTVLDGYSHASWTKPATASLLTSLLPSSHLAMSKPSRLSGDIELVSETLQGHGYTTGGIVSNINLAQSFGFDQGYDEYHYLGPDYLIGAEESSSKLIIYQIARSVILKLQGSDLRPSDFYQPANVVNATAFDWLERNGTSRFFLFLHYMDPHDPYFVRPLDGTGVARVTGDPEPEEAARLRDLYVGEIEYLDDQFGQLLARLRELGIYDETLIVLTADHGEEFHEHGGWWHGLTLYDEMIRVPLLVKWPRGEQALPSRATQEVARLIDVAPTLISRAGATVPPAMQGIDLTTPVGERYAKDREVYSEEDHEGNVLWSLRTTSEKLIEANPGNPRGLPARELFDIATDPDETQNVIETRSAVAERLAESADLQRRAAEGSAVDGGGEVEMTQAECEQLRMLGYVEDCSEASAP